MPVIFDPTWLMYIILAIAGILCVHCCLCVDCLRPFLFTAINALSRFIFACRNTLRCLLVTLAQTMAHPQPAPVVNHHHILDIRPEYGGDITTMIRDIVNTLQQVSFDYPSPEKLKKHRRLPQKYNTKGWRRKLNERWKKKMKFIRSMLLYVKCGSAVSSNDYQDEMEAISWQEYIEHSSYSSFAGEQPLEEFFLAPQRDEDDELDKTILFEGQPRTLTMYKSKPDGTRIPHWIE